MADYNNQSIRFLRGGGIIKQIAYLQDNPILIIPTICYISEGKARLIIEYLA